MRKSDQTLLGIEKSLSSGVEPLRIPAVGRLPDDSTKEADFHKLTETLLSGGDTEKLDELASRIQGFVRVTPEPGLCVKMKTKAGRKVFLNICTSKKVPSLEKDISEEELAIALQSSEITFRVPMSIGEPHEETDHAGAPCTAYEVVINPAFFAKIQQSELFHHFFVSVAMEGMEEKYGLELDRESVSLLKGKKVFGTIKEQNIRTKPRLITEIDASQSVSRSLDVVPAAKPEEFFVKPKVFLWLDPVDSCDRRLHVEISLPSLVSVKQVDLQVADDRLKLLTTGVKPKNYKLDVFFPVLVDRETADSHFDERTKILHCEALLR